MIFRIYKKSSSCCELKKINKIQAKASKKRSYYSSNSSSIKSGYDSSFYIDSDWDEEIQTTERKEINKLDHVVTDNIKKRINIMTP